MGCAGSSSAATLIDDLDRSPTVSQASACGSTGINQDCSLVSCPFDGRDNEALLGVFDGHGEQAEQISAWVRDELPGRLVAQRSKLVLDPCSAIAQTVHASMPTRSMHSATPDCSIARTHISHADR
jgi:serine/threonine protein phosphatase PrpC